MIKILVEMYFASLRIARTVDHSRIGSDADYRESVIADLCGAPAMAPCRARAGQSAPRTIYHAA